MLMRWSPHIVERDVPVLVWTASGGLGSIALQIVRYFGGLPVAVVSDDSTTQSCLDKGAVSVINRNNFNHWGKMPEVGTSAYNNRLKGARDFGKAF
jgi:crotonyl-CoA carboxylase/reductase